MSGAGRVGTDALVLGGAGLLPQILVIAIIASGGGGEFISAIVIFGLLYPLLILSFLGGIWWGMAMRRGVDQGRLAIVAVLPSLGALPLLAAFLVIDHAGRVLVAAGITMMLTLLVDRHLVTTGEAPDNWMMLRIPLSIGLGTLTVVAGVLTDLHGIPL